MSNQDIDDNEDQNPNTIPSTADNNAADQARDGDYISRDEIISADFSDAMTDKEIDWDALEFSATDDTPEIPVENHLMERPIFASSVLEEDTFQKDDASTDSAPAETVEDATVAAESDDAELPADATQQTPAEASKNNTRWDRFKNTASATAIAATGVLTMGKPLTKLSLGLAGDLIASPFKLAGYAVTATAVSALMLYKGARIAWQKPLVRYGLVLSPALLSVGQCSFKEDIPLNTSGAWMYTAKQTVRNYIDTYNYASETVVDGSRSIKSGWDTVSYNAGKAIDMGTSLLENGVLPEKTEDTRLSIPHEHQLYECAPYYTMDAQIEHAQEIKASRAYQSDLVNEWRKSNADLQVSLANGDTVILYQHFQNAASKDPTFTSHPAGEQVSCPKGYNQLVHSAHKWAKLNQ